MRENFSIPHFIGKYLFDKMKRIAKKYNLG